MSMMIGVAFSRGLVSIRTTPSMGTGISSSAGSDIGAALLNSCNLFYGSRFDWHLGEKGCERRDFVSGALDADHRRAVDVERCAHCSGKTVEVGDVHGRQAREHGCQTSAQPAGTESVVAVEVVIEQLLTGHAHGVGVVVEQHERHWKPVVHGGVHLHAVHEKRPVA